MKMNKKFKLAGLFLALALMVNTASADLLIEPHIAYNVSGSGDGYVGNITHDYKYNGAQLGARLGFQTLGFMTGLDYTRSSYDMEDTSASTTITRPHDKNELGLFIGYNFPILLRAWGTYYFTNTSKNDNDEKYSGNTKELGVGFTALPFLSINLMYRMIKFDEINSKSFNGDIDINEIAIGVSLPLTL